MRIGRLALATALLVASPARAEKPTGDPARTDEADAKREVGAALPSDAKVIEEGPGDEKTELAGAPILGGSTDIGFQIGFASTVTRVNERFRPYRWRLDGFVSASVKGGPRGYEVAQQSHDIRIDVPGAVNGKIRIMPGIFFERTVNAGYFGIGNAAPVVNDQTGRVGSRYQYIHQELRARVNMRTPIERGFSAMYGITLRYVDPKVYDDSKLDRDLRGSDGLSGPIVRGVQPLGHAVIAAGLLFDTRNNEIFPKRGAFDLFALRVGLTTPTSADVRYGALNYVFRRYMSLGGPFVLAGRVFADLMFGNPAFYDLSQGGAFIPIDLPGGAAGIRGIPNGRYQGLIKLVGNIEVRAMHTKFRLFGDKFQIGNVAFADVGRVWADYQSDPRDGRGLGLKYGVGGGFYVLWGTAALFRVEFAYSPDASAANPGFPIGIYAADSVMF